MWQSPIEMRGMGRRSGCEAVVLVKHPSNGDVKRLRQRTAMRQRESAAHDQRPPGRDRRGRLVSGLCSHRARSPGPCEACGLAEPDHAVSVNGRAAEPINSMGGAPSERVCAAARGASSRLEGCGTAMIENCTCSAFLDDSRRIPLPRKQEDGSAEGYAPIRKSRPGERAAIAGVSPYFRNHQFPFSYGDKRQNWLKPARLTPS